MRLKVVTRWLVLVLAVGAGAFSLQMMNADPNGTAGIDRELPLPAAAQYDAVAFSSANVRTAAGDEQSEPGDPIPIALLPGTSEERFDAIAMLSDSTDPLAILTLQSLLDDPEPLVREEAVESLADVGGSDAIAALGYALSDSDSNVRLLAIESLLEIGTDEAYGALNWTLMEEDVRLQRLVVQELSDHDSVGARALVEEFHARGVSLVD